MGRGSNSHDLGALFLRISRIIFSESGVKASRVVPTKDLFGLGTGTDSEKESLIERNVS